VPGVEAAPPEDGIPPGGVYCSIRDSNRVTRPTSPESITARTVSRSASKRRFWYTVSGTPVAAAPPKRFAGGGYWEAMKGDMTGWFEVRVDGPSRHHYRLFCRLDYDAEGRPKPLLVVIYGLDKPFRTELSGADYRHVRDFGEEYLRRNPRSPA
jgi:hypothetical protein